MRRRPQTFCASCGRPNCRGSFSLPRLYNFNRLRFRLDRAALRPHGGRSPRHHRRISLGSSRRASFRNFPRGTACRRCSYRARSKTFFSRLLILPIDGLVQGLRIVQVQHAAFFVCPYLFYFSRMGPHHRARARFERRMKQFVIQRCGKNDRVAAAPLVHRQDDGFLRLIKLLNQLLDQRAANQGVIDQAEQDSVGPWRQASQRLLDRAELSFFPIGIDDDFICLEVHSVYDRPRMRAKHNPPHANFWQQGHFQQMFQEGPPLVGKQRFRRAHAARGPARKNDGGQHVLPFSARHSEELALGVPRISISCVPRSPRSAERQSAPPRCLRQFLPERAPRSPNPWAHRRVRIPRVCSPRFRALYIPTILFVCFQSCPRSALPCAPPKPAHACLPCARASRSPCSSRHSDEAFRMLPRSSSKSPAPWETALCSRTLRGRPPLQSRSPRRWPLLPPPSKHARHQKDTRSVAAESVRQKLPAFRRKSAHCRSSLRC